MAVTLASAYGRAGVDRRRLARRAELRFATCGPASRHDRHVNGMQWLAVGGADAAGPLRDGLVVAVERGTPLGDVLRAQAADVREQHKRDLIEAGGRREVLMLVPSSIGLVNAADLRNR
jgi:hypothetical protein